MKHQEIIESLPWYVNGTLSQPERAEIVQHLATGCRECTEEVASLTALRKAVVAVGEDAPEPSPYLLNRALAQIEDYERSRVQAESRGKEKAGSSFRWLATMSAMWGRQTPVFARVALAVQMALLLAVGTVAVYQYKHPQTEYRVLTASPSHGNGAMVGVIFNENVSEREIRQTLDAIGGTIVGGPSAQNMYTIELKDIPQGNTVEIEKILDKLRQNKRVISQAQQAQ